MTIFNILAARRYWTSMGGRGLTDKCFLIQRPGLVVYHRDAWKDVANKASNKKSQNFPQTGWNVPQ